LPALTTARVIVPVEAAWACELSTSNALVTMSVSVAATERDRLCPSDIFTFLSPVSVDACVRASPLPSAPSDLAPARAVSARVRLVRWLASDDASDGRFTFHFLDGVRSRGQRRNKPLKTAISMTAAS
jgi:hypothetical protein